MQFKNIRSFIGGILIGLLVYGFFFILFLFSSFNLAGGETLGELERQRSSWLVTACILILFAIIFARNQYRSGSRWFARGLLVLPILALLFSLVSFWDMNLHHASYNRTKWLQTNPKPEAMAKTMSRSGNFIGRSREELKTELGAPAEEYSDSTGRYGSIVYTITNDWTFVILLVNNRSVEIRMHKPLLGI